MGDSQGSLDNSYFASFSLGASVLKKQRRGRRNRRLDSALSMTSHQPATSDLHSLLSAQQSGLNIMGVVSCSLISASQLLVEPSTLLYTTAHIQGVCKTSSLCKYSSEARFDYNSYIPVLVSRSYRNPDNLLRFSVYQVSTMDQNDTVIGSVSFNLHDLVSNKKVSGNFSIFQNDVVVGEISLLLQFFYGSLGYGYSCQIRDENMSAPQQIEKSLFPRLEPPQDRKDSSRSVLLPRAQHHPWFIEFGDCRTDLELGKYFKSVMPPPTARESVLRKPGEHVSDLKSRFPLVEKHLNVLNYRDKANELLADPSRISRLKELRTVVYPTKTRNHVLANDQEITPSETDNKFLKYLKPIKPQNS
ncbi:hypothetical protein GEMRC1_005241 [Eukaryota sp. GEM-RC1]